MFKCQVSGKISKPGEKPVRVVTETRPVVYYKKVRDELNGELVLAVGKNGLPIVEGQGFETVQEILMLSSAYEDLKLTI